MAEPRSEQRQTKKKLCAKVRAANERRGRLAAATIDGTEAELPYCARRPSRTQRQSGGGCTLEARQLEAGEGASRRLGSSVAGEAVFAKLLLLAELSPKVGDSGNRKGGISWGCLLGVSQCAESRPPPGFPFILPAFRCRRRHEGGGHHGAPEGNDYSNKVIALAIDISCS